MTWLIGFLLFVFAAIPWGYWRMQREHSWLIRGASNKELLDMLHYSKAPDKLRTQILAEASRRGLVVRR